MRLDVECPISRHHHRCYRPLPIGQKPTGVRGAGRVRLSGRGWGEGRSQSGVLVFEVALGVGC